MKFGGTSVGSAERMRAVCGLIAAEAAKRPVVAVVSAMSKITDLLLDTTRHAEGGDQAGVDQSLQQLEARHIAAVKDLVGPEDRERVECAVRNLIAEFRRIANGMLMLAYRPPRAVDEAIAIGVAAEAVNAAGVIVTDAVFNNASPVMTATKEKAQARLTPALEHGITPIVTGFNGATADGRPTTLG